MMAIMPGAAALWMWPIDRASSDALTASEPNYAGYKVVANDGEIGTVDSFALGADRGHVVVDTGVWFFGHKSLIPARAVRDVNDQSHTIQVDLTKDQIKNAPRYDEGAGWDGYRDRGGDYYRGLF